MSYTNHTTNYNLPLYVGTDKPTYLGDFNTAMQAIDTQMKANADSASTANTTATTASNAIGTLSSLNTTDKTSAVNAINEVNTAVGTAQSTANTAAANATSALAGVTRFNLTSHATLSPTTNKGTINTQNTSVAFATDSTSGVFKVYGRATIQGLANSTGYVTLKLGNTSLRPSSAYVINSGAIIVVRQTSGNAISGVAQRNVKVDTNGDISIVDASGNGLIEVDGATSMVDVTILPCLYFNTDFGDN